MGKLRGVCIGAGYFSQFHLEAWKRIPEVSLVAICDKDEQKAVAAGMQYDIRATYTDYRAMFEAEKPDFVDIITPPPSHEALCHEAGLHNIHIICQKPLAPDLNAAKRIVANATGAGVRMMVHENFRFQPWHRELKKLLDEGAIGSRLHSLTFQSRMGDGWGPDAYLGRQPYFRTMPRLLVYETGVHFIDTFRYLAGDVAQVYARLRRLNPVIQGEDCGLLLFTFENGALGMWDANRYNASPNGNLRYTFGTFLIEGSEGSMRLYEDGKITIQKLGEEEKEHPYHHEKRGFAGDCCYFTQRHFVEALISGAPFETAGRDYLNVLRIQDAIYQSAETNFPVELI